MYCLNSLNSLLLYLAVIACVNALLFWHVNGGNWSKSPTCLVNVLFFWRALHDFTNTCIIHRFDHAYKVNKRILKRDNSFSSKSLTNNRDIAKAFAKQFTSPIHYRPVGLSSGGFSKSVSLIIRCPLSQWTMFRRPPGTAATSLPQTRIHHLKNFLRPYLTSKLGSLGLKHLPHL